MKLKVNSILVDERGNRFTVVYLDDKRVLVRSTTDGQLKSIDLKDLFKSVKLGKEEKNETKKIPHALQRFEG